METNSKRYAAPRHLYYFDPKSVDISKLRKDAQEALAGDYRTMPASVATIHYHKHGEACTPQCEVYKHKDFQQS